VEKAGRNMLRWSWSETREMDNEESEDEGMSRREEQDGTQGQETPEEDREMEVSHDSLSLTGIVRTSQFREQNGARMREEKVP
jgi:hypothetical protein